MPPEKAVRYGAQQRERRDQFQRDDTNECHKHLVR
jgi:hypothetical protein